MKNLLITFLLALTSLSTFAHDDNGDIYQCSMIVAGVQLEGQELPSKELAKASVKKVCKEVENVIDNHTNADIRRFFNCRKQIMCDKL